jgi:hypothetical protein
MVRMGMGERVGGHLMFVELLQDAAGRLPVSASIGTSPAR